MDIVACDGETVVFVEVKARASDRWGSPGDAITPWKRRKLLLMACDYLARSGYELAKHGFTVDKISGAAKGYKI